MDTSKPSNEQTGPSSEFSEKYPHLLKKTALMLEQPLLERTIFIRTDKYIPTAASIAGLRALLDAFAYPRVIRQPGVAIVGETSDGKSALLREFCRLALAHPNSQGRRIPIADMTMPTGVNEQRFNLSLVRGLKVPGLENASSTGIATHIMYTHLDKTMPRAIIVQECNNMAHTSKKDIKLVCDLMKNITHDKGIMWVLSGTPEFLPVINRRDTEQLGNRIREEHLLPLSNAEQLQSFLMTLEGYYPFPESSHLYSDKVLQFVGDHTGGVVGKVVWLLDEAAYQAALKNESKITFEYIKQASLVKYVSSANGYSSPGKN